MEPALVKAVVWRESQFDPRRRGRAGEFGLMQLRTAAGQEWAGAVHVAGFKAECLYDPLTNACAGAWYLDKLLKRYLLADNPLPYTLADYNADAANVLKWEHGVGLTNSAAFLEQIGFPGTQGLRALRAAAIRALSPSFSGGSALKAGVAMWKWAGKRASWPRIALECAIGGTGCASKRTLTGGWRRVRVYPKISRTNELTRSTL